jgi:DNA-binding transcriptional ArsR family regulator
MDENENAAEATGDGSRRRRASKRSPVTVKNERPRSIESEARPEKYAMGKSSTVRVDRPPVSDITFSKIPFGPVVRRLRPGTVKVLAAVARSSWVDSDTRRRVTFASNGQLAELAAVADPETIGRHIRKLAEAGLLTIDEHEDRRRLTLPDVQPGEFVVLDNADPAWSSNPVPFVVLLAVHFCDWSNRGQVWPTDAYIARSTGLSVQSVSRAMTELRRAGAVVTSSRAKREGKRYTRKRVIILPGKVTTLCAESTTRKSDEWVPGKVTTTHPENRLLPTRKSDYLNQNSEREFLTTTATTNQPTIESTGQSERAETAEAEVVVVAADALTDTDQEPKAEAPADMAEVIALLSKSELSRDEQERYLAITRKMVEPPPIAWHVHALDVKPSSGTKSIAGVVISRLKEWTTTPTDQRAAIIDAIVSKDAEVIAKRLKSAKFWYEGYLKDLKDGHTQVVAKVRERWERYNAALKAAGQPPVVLPNEVIHAERGQRPSPPLSHIPNVMPRRAKTPNESILAEPVNAVPPPPPPPVDPSELERRRRERAERERVEAEQRERTRIFEERVRIEREQAEEVNRRQAAWTNRRTAELLPAMRADPASMRQRIAVERAVEAERIEAEVRAEFAPKFAALAPPPAPTRKPPGPPPGPPATIPAMASR